jgi:hypothetical protein
MLPSRLRLLSPFAAAALLALATACPASAHVVEHAGPYTIEVGWQREPTYVGDANGVQIIVSRGENKPITDLTADDLKAVVSTGGQQTRELTFEPAFDPEEMEGTLGEYDAPIKPTAPGDYTFHITGSIHGQGVDITVTSGDATFDTVKGTSDIEFPTKLPTLPEIATRLERIDARLTAAQAPASGQAAVEAAQTSAGDARSAADRALLIGGGIGTAGLVVAALALVVAVRGRPAAV